MIVRKIIIEELGREFGIMVKLRNAIQQIHII